MGADRRQNGAIFWGVAQRLAFIDTWFYWGGSVSRVDLARRFCICTQQASADLGRYAEIAPGDMAYNRSLKRYKASEIFQLAIVKPDPARYLAQLLIGDRAANEADSWLDTPPAFDLVSGPLRRIDPVVLKRYVAAVRDVAPIKVFYQSMSLCQSRSLIGVDLRLIPSPSTGSDGIPVQPVMRTMSSKTLS
ncbi:hypothetical protein JL100_015380 [Skermanella mucosa]|uniref:hypothetical protein n=1 Tax=Skermanella mucosa TaxID=1789672 RepID=UPI001E3B4B01|nr:hypothetical protein [Skermanella mucosa]UEM18499.1 hypothetical protein JL100_015380 [Skermanella mucosa]